jgi:hypothetical protein
MLEFSPQELRSSLDLPHPLLLMICVILVWSLFLWESVYTGYVTVICTPTLMPGTFKVSFPCCTQFPIALSDFFFQYSDSCTFGTFLVIYMRMPSSLFFWFYSWIPVHQMLDLLDQSSTASCISVCIHLSCVLFWESTLIFYLKNVCYFHGKRLFPLGDWI